jgi:outer membrane protein OmpA-like peptidoglycan-associated protein
MILFFDMESADLTPEARSIVLSAVDAAERIHSGQIQLATYSSSGESAHDSTLAVRRAEAVKALIADYGYRGHVTVDEEAPDVPLVAIGDDTFDRSAILRLAGER